MKRIAIFLWIQTVLLTAAAAAEGKPRLAIGTFGLPESRDAQLGALVSVRLSSVADFDLVERQELNAVLGEARLGLAGLARSKEAVRVGALLRADGFLLGRTIPINGTNRLVVRQVDARTGTIQSVGVFTDRPGLESLAVEIADFARDKAPSSANATHRDFLAIGVIQNLGVNNRFPDFPAQLRGNLTALLSTNVILLEREVVSFLADEMRLDMGGLTADEGKRAGPMQFGYWLVDGFYQSSELAEPEVQIQLRVERIPGDQQIHRLQGKPDEAFFARIGKTIAQALRTRPEAGGAVGAPPSRQGEIAALEARARELVDYRSIGPLHPRLFPYSIWLRSALNPDKMASTLEEATRVFESILLIDPRNNAAKMRLAGCLLYDDRRLEVRHRFSQADREARASDLLREVVDTRDPEYTEDAQLILALTRGGLEGVSQLHQLAAAAVNPAQKYRFRYHRSDLLRSLEYDLPIESVLPALRTQLIDELTDLRNSTNAMIRLSLDEVLFAYRFAPQKRDRIINQLLPGLLAQFPELVPHLLLAAAAEQTEPNAPVTAQFLASLRECETNRAAVWRSSDYFRNLSSTLEEEDAVRKQGGCTQYQRTFDNKQHLTLVAMARARHEAAEKGLAPPLTALGKLRLAEAHMALRQWQEALHLLETLPEASAQAKNDCRRHLGAPTESEEIADTVWRSETDLNKVQIAYQCIERRQFKTAVAILDSIGHRTVRMSGSGPWGYAFTPVLPAVVAAAYRSQAGQPAVRDPRRFELGDTPYVHFVRDGARLFSFQVESEDLWLATYSEIKRFRGPGPFPASEPAERFSFERTTRSGNSSICVGRDFIWAGTADDGLFELNRRAKTVRRLTMNDGLALPGVAGLQLQGQNLWITYRNDANGAVGTLHVPTRKFSTHTANLPASAGANSRPYYEQSSLEDVRQAPHLPVSAMAEAEPGEMWFAVQEKGVQRFRTADARWDTPWPASMRNGYFADLAAEPSQGLLLLAIRETTVLDGARSATGGLAIYDYRQSKHFTLRNQQGLPSNDISAVAVEGRIAWVGGRGFVAVVDVRERKVLRTAYVSASRIQDIQLSPAHAWIQISCAVKGDPQYCGNAWTGIYRVPRAGLEPVLQTEHPVRN